MKILSRIKRGIRRLRGKPSLYGIWLRLATEYYDFIYCKEYNNRYRGLAPFDPFLSKTFCLDWAKMNGDEKLRDSAAKEAAFIGFVLHRHGWWDLWEYFLNTCVKNGYKYRKDIEDVMIGFLKNPKVQSERPWIGFKSEHFMYPGTHWMVTNEDDDRGYMYRWYMHLIRFFGHSGFNMKLYINKIRIEDIIDDHLWRHLCPKPLKRHIRLKKPESLLTRIFKVISFYWKTHSFF